MEKSYEKNRKNTFSRDAIIGLGEDSFKKNYYPELRAKIAELEQVNSRNHALISMLPDNLLIYRTDMEIESFDGRTSEKKELLVEILEDQEIIEKIKETAKYVLETDKSETLDLIFRDKHNEIRYLEARFRKDLESEVLIIIRDMSERIALENRLREMLLKDSMTGLYNRRGFDGKMSELNGKELENISLLSIDANGLKIVNDTLGHLEGDQYLITVAKILKDAFGGYGFIARIGGDEFCIIIENISREKNKELINNLKTRLKNQSFNKHAVPISISYGYAYHEKGFLNMEELFREADHKMYKEKMKNTIEIKKRMREELLDLKEEREIRNK